MIIKKHLVVKKNGTCRLCVNQPGLDWDEISVQLEVSIPNAIFDRPRFEAKITIPDDASLPDIINTEVIENAKDAIEQATGLTFSINVVKNISENGDS